MQVQCILERIDEIYHDHRTDICVSLPNQNGTAVLLCSSALAAVEFDIAFAVRLDDSIRNDPAGT